MIQWRAPCFSKLNSGSGPQLGSVLLPVGHLAMSGKVFVFNDWGGGEWTQASEWVETRGAATHPTMHKTALTTRSYLVQNVKDAKFEKP